MYALNIAEDGRIMSATYPQYAQADAVIVETLPEGNLLDYRYVDGEYIHDPLPTTEPMPTQEERIAELEAQNEMLLQCVLEMSEIVYA